MQFFKIEPTARLLLVSTLMASAVAAAGPIDQLAPGQWYEFPNSALRGVVPSPAPGGDPEGVIDAFSGGTFDTRRNRLMVWGGGHTDYAGNEVYAFDVASGKWSRLTNPTSTPSSVHTYDQVEYLPNQDMFFAAGGSRWPGGEVVPDTWLFNLNTNAWVHGGLMPSTADDFWYYNMTSDYDPLSGRTIMVGLNRSGSYDPASRTWSLTGEGHGWALGLTGALDTKRRRYVEVGRGNVYSYSAGSNGALGTRQTLSTSGPQAIVGCGAPGFVYDPVSDRFVGWCGGNAVYTLNLDTLAWTQHAATNGVNPGDPYTRSRPYWGTFGRFDYMPAHNAFIIAHGIDENVFVYRLTSGGGTAPAAPLVSISASPASVSAGGSVNLSWSTQNVSACTASGGWTGTRATSGQQSVGPLGADTSFTLTCTGTSGTAANTASVTVQAAAGGGSTGGTTGGSTGGSTGSSTGGGTGASTGSSTDANADWSKRSTAPGVVRAVGFDTQSDWQKHLQSSGTNCNPAYAPGCRTNAWDTAVKASGAGAVRFDILSQSYDSGAGSLAVNFSDDYSVQFGANEEFWVQWRQRFDAYMIDHNYRENPSDKSGEWKQIILSQGDRRRADGSVILANSCNEFELVVQNSSGLKFPSSYIECGGYYHFEAADSAARFTRMNQRVGTSGEWTCQSYPRGGNTSGCLWYYPNEWMTFMVHLKMGPEGRARSSASGREQPGFIDSTYEIYIARQGQPFQLAHRQEDLVIPRGQYWNPAAGVNPDNIDDPGYGGSGWDARDAHPEGEYGKIWLLPYHSYKDPAEVHEKASTWYDELIISTQPIAAPGAGSGGGTAPPPAPAPSAAISASPASVSAGGSSTLSWSSQNASSCTASGGWSGTRATSGQQSVGPLAATTTFSVNCGGATASTTVTVQASTGGSGNTGNQPPEQPLLEQPSAPLALDESQVDSASGYADPNGDALGASEWQIARDQQFTQPVLGKLLEGRTELKIAAGVLDPSSSYWVRTRHKDARGGTSAWSEPVAVTTAVALPGDANRNGTSDSSEVAGFADTNGNGTNDSTEGICNLLDPQGGNVIGLESQSGDIRCYKTVANDQVPPPPSRDMQFPYGMFSFRIEGLRVDPTNPARAIVRVHLPQRPSGSVKWYKLDPASGQVFELASSVTFEGNTALIELVDGGLGDFDGVVNGVIVDPSGPLSIPASGSTGGGSGSGSGSGGGSCIGALLPSLMAGAGWLRRAPTGTVSDCRAGSGSRGSGGRAASRPRKSRR